MSASKVVKLVEIGWLQYAERILPTNASRAQKWETRRAFYAGAAHLFRELVERIGPEANENASVAQLQAVSDELERFLLNVQRGKR